MINHASTAVGQVALASALIAGCRPDASEPEFPRGPHSVGFATETLTRSVEVGEPRRLQLSLWYPRSTGGAGRPLLIGDLFDLLRTERQFPELDGMPIDRAFPAVMTGDSSAIPTRQSLAALATPTTAQLDLLPDRGPFPLVLWTSRHATVLAQAPLAEALASLGFVVATVWSSDPPLAFIWEDRPEAERLATVEAQTEDLISAIARLGDRPWVDTSRIVAAAWSYGGQTAARLQERIAAVRGVVSLDANVLPSRPEERLSLRRPLVNFIGQDTSRRGLDRIPDLTAPVVLVRLGAVRHGEFNALEGYYPAVFAADTMYPWSRKGAAARDSYRDLGRLVSAAVRLLLGSERPTATALADRLRAVLTPPATAIEVHNDDGRRP